MQSAERIEYWLVIRHFITDKSGKLFMIINPLFHVCIVWDKVQPYGVISLLCNGVYNIFHCQTYLPERVKYCDTKKNLIDCTCSQLDQIFSTHTLGSSYYINSNLFFCTFEFVNLCVRV